MITLLVHSDVDKPLGYALSGFHGGSAQTPLNGLAGRLLGGWAGNPWAGRASTRLAE